MTAFGRFLYPGPTDVRPEVLQAMAQPMMPHRSPAFEAVHARVVSNLQDVFQTTRPVYAVTASATALMEMAIRGAPEGSILSLVNGAFSERFAAVAEACGRRVTRVVVPWGGVHPLGLVEWHLAAEPFAALTVVHSETSTGALCDLRVITELAHRYGVMCLADAVTSVGACAVRTDAWGVDFVLTGSQKALALPPGLAFAVASEAYILQAAVIHGRGRYLDPVAHERAALRGGPPSTPAIPLFFAADRQLQDMLAEGLEARWARHGEMQLMVEHWVAARNADGMAITFVAPSGARSPSVSCLRLPPSCRSYEVVAALAARGFTIGRGYGQLEDSTIRIGHMGDLRPEHLAPCLDALTDVLRTGPTA
jgi:aspartate aminotransferase-like enzyme